MSAASLRVVDKAEKENMESKNKALDAALSQIERAFGKGSIMKLGQRDSGVEIGSVSTGSLGLDIALGIGGLPRGRIVEIYGPESSGKTTLALHCIAEAQKSGGTCAFIDAEHALDPSYAKKLGVDVENLLISQPDAGEQALEIADTLVRSGAVDVLVVDSVAALVPRAELAPLTLMGITVVLLVFWLADVWKGTLEQLILLPPEAERPPVRAAAASEAGSAPARS